MREEEEERTAAAEAVEAREPGVFRLRWVGWGGEEWGAGGAAPPNARQTHTDVADAGW